MPPAPVSLVHHVAGNEGLVGALVGVTHGAGHPGAQAVARLRASRAGGAGLKYTLIITVHLFCGQLSEMLFCVNLQIKFNVTFYDM